MGNFFGTLGRLFRGSAGQRQDLVPEPLAGVPYKKGDFIHTANMYKVKDVLGVGSFGVVYLVHSRQTKEVYAMKTFLDEYLVDAETRERFHTEAQMWVALGWHPYLVRAHFVDEYGGRLYIAMEYIAKDRQGRNSLEDYFDFKKGYPPDFAQSLRWAIQFCHGMEYTHSKEDFRSHRDIKPDNILISQDRTVKITDLGLAGVLESSKAASEIKVNIHQGRVGLSLFGKGCGTPTYMSPEHFTNAVSCDQRSDIYSFGIVLYQMAAGGRLPFLAPWPENDSEKEKMRFWNEMKKLHSESTIPRLDSPLFPTIQRCIEKEPGNRYQTFEELRKDLEPLLMRTTGEAINPPKREEDKFEESLRWGHKGHSLYSLGRYEESIACFDKVLEIDPRDALPWNSKGFSLYKLGRYEESIACFDKALEIDQRYADTWNNKGLSLISLGRYEEAIVCYDKALEIDPRHSIAWSNKGYNLIFLGRYEEAIECCDKALEIDPRITFAWNKKGNSLYNLGRYEEAMECYDKALKIDPRDANDWGGKGASLISLGRYKEAMECYDKVLEIDPRHSMAWNNKGFSLIFLGRYEEAIVCCDKALEIDQRYADVWNNKGRSLYSLGRYEEAIACLDKALEINPRHSTAWSNKGFNLGNLGRYEEAIECYDKALEINLRNAEAWYNKAVSEDKLGWKQDAIRSYKQFIDLAPARFPAEIENARKRVRELEGEDK